MRIRPGAVCVFVLLSSVARAQGAGAAPPDLEKSLRAFESAWQAHDGKAVAALFATDATFINPRGERAEGHDAIAKRFQEDFDTRLVGVSAKLTVERTRMIEPGLAFLDVRQELTGGKPPPGTPTPWVAHVVVLARKGPGGDWAFLDVRPYFFLPAGHPGRDRGRPGASGSAPARGGDVPGNR